MKSVYAAAALALVASTSTLAHADVIRCSFTEPFYNTSYDTAQQTLTILSPEDKKDAHRVLRGVYFQIRGAADFELIDAKGKVIQELKITGHGSDGMSDRVFPYEVKWNGLHGNNVGGCESNLLKAVDPTN